MSSGEVTDLSSERPNLERDVEREMREEWDARSRDNAFHYIADSKDEWRPKEFFASGEESVRQLILNDMDSICQEMPSTEMRVLEIGCGAGRMTRALAKVFGEVHGVDVSGGMIERARELLADCSNVHLYQNSGSDLSVLGDLEFDFAFSFIAFQHIPSNAIIENYVREVHRVLRPGRLFKFQVQGSYGAAQAEHDTWLGPPISGSEAIKMAENSGFRLSRYEGLGKQYFWLWYIKPTAEGGSPLEPQSEIALLQHRAERLDAELEIKSRMLEDLGATMEQELSDRTRWAKRLDAELEQAHKQLQAIYGSLAYRIGRRLRLAPDPPPTPKTLAESAESKECSHQDDESKPAS